MEVSLRCHNTPRQNGWRSASDVTHRKHAEVLWGSEERELSTRRQTRRIDFWSSQSRGERASVFEWHKRFKEGRESVRDDERCGRSKEVRTPELIGQIKNLMDKDRRVSIDTISAQFDVGVGTVHTIICEELKMWKICAKFVPYLSQTIWPRWSTRQFFTHPIVQTSLPVTFGYSLSSRKTLEAVVMRQLRR